MNSATQATIAGIVLSTAIGLGWWGVYAWSHHHDVAMKQYEPGSVCDREFATDNAYENAIVQTAASDRGDSGQDFGTGDTPVSDAATEEAADQRSEFQNILDGLGAANQAVQARGGKALFCLPKMLPEKQAELYDVYWAATEVRAKQDVGVCRRGYAEDVLAYMASAYPCGA
jgi:hypothetical protein